MRVLLILLLLLACATPDRAFFGVDPVRVTREGRDYDVYVRRSPAPVVCRAGASLADCRAEGQPIVQVIRLGYARRGQHEAIVRAMLQAAEQASGCALVDGSVQGDSGVMTARLRCPG